MSLFIAENWFIIVVLAALILFAVLSILCFLKLPRKEQMNAIREWLLMAVTEAEKELGGGTGKLKLRYVYDLFVTRFPWAAQVVSFDTFSDLVDEALVEMRDMLDKNRAVQMYVKEDAR